MKTVLPKNADDLFLIGDLRRMNKRTVMKKKVMPKGKKTAKGKKKPC